MLQAVLLQLLYIFKLALFLRVIIDYIKIFARNWNPNIVFIFIFEVVYSITDRPMRFVARYIPPLRLGGVAIDLSFIALLIGVNFAQQLVRVLL